MFLVYVKKKNNSVSIFYTSLKSESQWKKKFVSLERSRKAENEKLSDLASCYVYVCGFHFISYVKSHSSQMYGFMERKVSKISNVEIQQGNYAWQDITFLTTWWDCYPLWQRQMQWTFLPSDIFFFSFLYNVSDCCLLVFLFGSWVIWFRHQRATEQHCNHI